MSMSPPSFWILIALGLQAQRPEYDFYREGRDKRPEAYAEELRKARVPASATRPGTEAVGSQNVGVEMAAACPMLKDMVAQHRIVVSSSVL